MESAWFVPHIQGEIRTILLLGLSFLTEGDVKVHWTSLKEKESKQKGQRIGH